MKKVTRNTDDKSLICLTFFLLLSPQIQNADDVLITPLEKFRKEQIGAAKVGDHLHEQLAIEKRRGFFFLGVCVRVCSCTLRVSSSPPPQQINPQKIIALTEVS